MKYNSINYEKESILTIKNGTELSKVGNVTVTDAGKISLTDASNIRYEKVYEYNKDNVIYINYLKLEFLYTGQPGFYVFNSYVIVDIEYYTFDSENVLVDEVYDSQNTFQFIPNKVINSYEVEIDNNKAIRSVRIKIVNKNNITVYEDVNIFISYGIADGVADKISQSVVTGINGLIESGALGSKLKGLDFYLNGFVATFEAGSSKFVYQLDTSGNLTGLVDSNSKLIPITDNNSNVT